MSSSWGGDSSAHRPRLPIGCVMNQRLGPAVRAVLLAFHVVGVALMAIPGASIKSTKA